MDAAGRSSLHSPTLAAVVCAGVVAVPLAIIGVHYAARFDFIPYWTSAHLLAAGHNPYDRTAIFALEKAAGNREAAPFIMRNPPWALPLIAPLGYFGVRTGAFLWFLWMLLLAGLSVWLLTRDRPEARPRAALFAPLLIALMLGQLTTFVLLASAFFLAFAKKRPFVSGTVLALAAVKAHLLVLVWPVLLLDCYRRRDWRVPAGLLTGLALLTCGAYLLDPHAWLQYREAMIHDSLMLQYLPNISADFRFLCLRRHPSVQLVPSVLGVAWAFWYYARSRWDWMEQGAVLFAISTLLSPYSWSCDMALMLPAVLRVRTGQRFQDLYLVCCVLSFLLSLGVHSWASPWLSLIGPLWMGWYLMARRSRQCIPAESPLKAIQSQ